MKYRDQLDPELRRIAKRIPYNKAIIYAANLFQTASFFFTKVSEKVSHRNMTMEGYRGLKFRVEIFEPAGGRGKLPCLLYAHGGAFSYKASAHHKKLACMYSEKAGCRVFFPDYHLTPKYPYPAAYDDVLALYKYIEVHAEELGVDEGKIGVAGDSAGGALAALLCNRCEREGLRRPCLQMLIYPLTDIGMGTESMQKFPDTPLWNAKNNRRMWQYYCRDLNGEEAYNASPMYGGLPQIIPDTYIETAEYDCLRDEGIQYGKRLRDAGAKVEINETRGTIHGYDVALKAKIAAENIEKRILFLKKGFQGGASA